METPLPFGHLSANFTLQEMIKSQTATRKGIDNAPTKAHVDALQALCRDVLELVRDQFKRPITITSGYRSKALCQAIGSKTTSQHAKGQAADFEIRTIPNYDVACWIRDNLEFDQLILEFYDGIDPNSGWIHVSYRADGNNRKQCLRYDGKKYKAGLGHE